MNRPLTPRCPKCGRFARRQQTGRIYKDGDSLKAKTQTKIVCKKDGTSVSNWTGVLASW